MNKTIWLIFKKDIRRFFTDLRLVLASLVMPPVLFTVMCVVLGASSVSMFSISDDYECKIAVMNPSDYIMDYIKERNGVSKKTDFIEEIVTKKNDISIEEISDYMTVDNNTEISINPDSFVVVDSFENMEDNIRNKKYDLYVIYPEDLDTIMMSDKEQTDVQQISIYYSSAEKESVAVYKEMLQLLNGYEESVYNIYDINSGEKTYDVATDKDKMRETWSNFIPFLLMIFIFSSASTMAPTEISRDKSNGVLNSMLVAPISRRELAVGKILSITFISILQGIANSISIVIVLPIALANLNSVDNTYGLKEYMQLVLVVLITVSMIVAVFSVLSTFSKDTKEATMLTAPITLVSTLISMSANLGHGAKESICYYFVPIYNSLQCFVGLFSFELDAEKVLITCVVNLLVTGTAIFIITKMFQSEKIMFRR